MEDAGERGVLPVAAGTTCSLVADVDRFGELAPALADAMRRLGLEVLGEPSGGALVHVVVADEDGLAAAGRFDRPGAEGGLPIAHVLLREGEAWWSESGVVGRDVRRGRPNGGGWRPWRPCRVPPGASPSRPSPRPASPGRWWRIWGAACPERLRVRRSARARGGPRRARHLYALLPAPPAVLPPGTGASSGPLGEEEFLRRAARLMGSRTGGSPGEYGQLPLHVSVTTVADPMGTLRGARTRVIGVGRTSPPRDTGRR
ncbi:hypothetical protein ACIBI9_11255 [Nonomuraea sp. NPDC050451]|uniref:hypothetical protein n=1 Tax=Nonomuraea sp. NPDC050451 TaxID=3364364 RepID=UPI0037B13E90